MKRRGEWSVELSLRRAVGLPANRVMRDEGSSWNKLLKRYMEEIGISVRDLELLDKGGIRAKVREYDNRKWREEMEAKSTLWVYRKFKRKIEEEKFYDNSWASEILFSARTNTLVLEDLKRHSKEDTSCKICDIGEKEDLGHFIIRCNKLNWFRNKDLMGVGEEENILGKLLFDRDKMEEVKRMLGRMWRESVGLLLWGNPPHFFFHSWSRI